MHANKTDQFKLHPLSIVLEIIELYGDDIDFEFSHYTYKRNTIEDNRTTFKISAKSITEDFLIDLCDKTPSGNNLAFHSTVYFNNGITKHIPMIDLATRAVGVISKILNVLPNELANKMIWFESGRSLHGYGTYLITPQSWMHFMGRLLLANQPQQHPVVDPRWIGHRLIAGYSALRWTKNTDDYIQIPQLVKNIHLIQQK